MTIDFMHEDMINSEPDQWFKEESTQFNTFNDTARMSDIMFQAGFFKSKGEAKRNGWHIDVPPGFSGHHVGKRSLFIMNKFPNWDKPLSFWEDDDEA